LMSLKNLYEDLVKHLENARDAKNHEQYKRVRGMMLEIKSYARLLEADLSRLNQFYNGKKAWPENILKIRQTIYKKRHAQVLMEKKASSSKQESDVPKMGSKASSGGSYEFTELEHASAARTENKTAMSSDASFGLREVGQKLEAHWAEDEDMWLFLARGGGAA
jgi:phage shock protein A